MKYKIIKIEILIILIISTISIYFISPPFPAIIAWFIKTLYNVDLKGYGVKLNYRYIPPELQQKPFIINFSNQLNWLSNGKVNVKIINTYTVGSFTKGNPREIKGLSNFLDPKSKYKDAWFGVYILFDDNQMLGRNYILKDPNGSPHQLTNLKIEAINEIPKLDQKLIVFTTFGNNNSKALIMLDEYSIFNETVNTSISIITLPAGQSWLKTTGYTQSISALTNIQQTEMHSINSIKSHVGLPNYEVYKIVNPWHPITIKASTITRYFKCSGNSFWAIVYYNGTSFSTIKEENIDTWENSNIQEEFQKMFENLEIGCSE